MPGNNKKRGRYYARFHDLSDALMIVLDIEGTLISLNRKACEILGFEEDEIIGKSAIDTIIAEDQRPRAQRYFTAVGIKADGRHDGTEVSSSAFELAMRTRTGGRRAVAWKTSCEKNKRGNITEILCWGADLTEHDQDGAWIQTYSNVLDTLHTITADTERSSENRIQNILELGRKTFSMRLAIVSRIEGQRYTVEHISAPEGAPEPGAVFDLGETYCVHTLRADGPRYFDHAGRSEIRDHPCYRTFGLESYIGIPLVVAGKRYGTLNFSDNLPRSRPFNAYDIALIRLLGDWVQNQISQEITQSTLRTMNQNLTHFKNVLDCTLDCVFMFDPESLRFTYVNNGAVKQVGYSQEEMMSMTAYDIKPDFSENTFRQMLAFIMAKENRKKTFETVHLTRDGSRIPVEIFLQYVEPENGSARWVAIVRDITERKKIDRMKTEFVSTVSHELRTPMTSINGAIGLLSNAFDYTLSEEALTLFQLTQRNSARLVRLLDDVLDIEKIEAGKMEFHLGGTDLYALAMRAMEEACVLANSYGVSLIFNTRIDNAPVHADPDRIHQVLANLLSNAFKFSPKGGNITVELNRSPAGYRLSISDHGPGIPDTFHDKIFGKFAQADPSDARNHGGSGLGLSICKAIMENHDGEIGYTSPPGCGATFFITLPHADMAQAPC
ncbi:PAS domain S-box protein [Varunaivibrio sulfuroxidans]|uniref:histidine kinase n=1 Tax=Varunaivibrio sulfuroxidans TaxID=1773489 RepID=A0A4R3JB17_9PROT|nr:PAS domain S-box protein [Varunaivibrio sulfuroxidans]TCS62535.1 PAS domain S-box-containing protein [Varunaivibrio sulfuroxidans]WES30795.1 PAS domain S-box protein [Varunaivibrio sulfuroxidans]